MRSDSSARLFFLTLVLTAGISAALRVRQSLHTVPGSVWVSRYEPKLRALVQGARVEEISERQWQERLHNVTLAGAADPCRAPALLTLHACEGFGWRMNAFVNEVMMSMQVGAPVALCGSTFAIHTWMRHFSSDSLKLPRFAICNSSECSGDGKLSCKGYLGKIANIGRISEQHPLADAVSSGIPEVDAAFWVLAPTQSSVDRFIRLKRFVTRAVFQFNAATQSLVDRRLIALGLQTNYVGVHIRRSDKQLEADPLPISRYAAAVAEYLYRYSLRTVYVASDEPDWASNALRDALRTFNNLTISVVAQSQENVGPQAVSGAQKRHRDEYAELPLLGLLTDMEALRRSMAFVGTSSSNIGQLIYFLRDEPSKANNFGSYGIDRPFEIADRDYILSF